MIDLLGRRAAQSHAVIFSEADHRTHHHRDLARVFVHTCVSVLDIEVMARYRRMFYVYDWTGGVIFYVYDRTMISSSFATVVRRHLGEDDIAR